MGVCTAFCFYGTVALCWDKNNIRVGFSDRQILKDGTVMIRPVKYKQKHSDVSYNDLEEDRVRLPLVPNCHLANDTHASTFVEMTELPSKCHNSHDAIKNMHNNADQEQSNRQQDQMHAHNSQPFLSTIESTNKTHLKPSPTKSLNYAKSQNKQFITTIILAVALLIQSLSNTILTVLWPLLVHDRFRLSAQTFGVLTFLSSMASMGAMASFPVVEKRVGRVRCAAGGFAVAALLGVVFCICTFGESFGNNEVWNSINARPEDSKRILVAVDSRHFNISGINEEDSALFVPWHDLNVSAPKTYQQNFTLKDIDGILHSFFKDYSLQREDNNTTMNDPRSNSHRINKIVDNDQSTHPPYLWHALSAIALHSSLSFLEPSIKSILSIVTTSPSLTQESVPKLGFTMGFMTTISNIGGMIGNITGAWMYKLSNENESVLSGHIFVRGGSLAFSVSALLLGASSLCIWGLEEPINSQLIRDTHDGSRVNETNCNVLGSSLELAEESESIPDICCIALRERELNHDVKCD